MGRTYGMLVAVFGLLIGTPIAHAHISLEQGGTHKSRSGDGAPFGTTLKGAPCGVAGSTRGTTNIYTYKPGEKITIKWVEYIAHPGHCRLAFAKDGDAFPDPDSYTDVKTNLPFDLGNGISVLADNIQDPPSGNLFTQEITLPNVECTNCTIQLIQVMTDKPPYAIGTDDVYHQCIDIVIKADSTSGTGGTMAGTGGTTAGTGGVAAGTGGVAAGTGGVGAGTGGIAAGTGGAMAGAGGATSGTGGMAGTAGMGTTGGAAALPGTGGAAAPTGTPSKKSSSGGCDVTSSRAAALDSLVLMIAALALLRRRGRRPV